MTEADAKAWLESKMGSSDIDQMEWRDCKKVIELIYEKDQPENMDTTNNKLTAVVKATTPSTRREPATPSPKADCKFIQDWLVTLDNKETHLMMSWGSDDSPAVCPVSEGKVVCYTLKDTTQHGGKYKVMDLDVSTPANRRPAKGVATAPPPPPADKPAQQAPPKAEAPKAEDKPAPPPSTPAPAAAAGTNKPFAYENQREKTITKIACVNSAINAWATMDKTVLGGEPMTTADIFRIATEIETFVTSTK